MKELTPKEQQRIWKKYMNPIRKILLWGQDSQKNPCLLILYGEHETEREIKSSPRSYYVDAYLLKSVVEYTHYAVFHGVNGHLPSIPNTYFSTEDNLLCYKRGYRTANINWKYNSKTRRYERSVNVEEQYVIKEFYKVPQNISFDYYEENSYSDYISFFKSNNITFEDFEFIEEPSDLFGFSKDSKYYNIIINMFSKERLYTRRKNLNQFIKMQPSIEEYERILKISSVELACGIFQELALEKNPILLEYAKQIDKSDILWAKKEYHNGLKRCVKQYINLFDENLIKKQKEFIYKTLPEMDLHIKKLKLYNDTLTGQELEDYLNGAYAYSNLVYQYVFGNQKLYEKNNYTDGKNIYNIKFKDTIQTAKAYGMADAIGKIAYYFDSPRLSCYFRGSGKTSAYNYYIRYIRRILDEYKEKDEEKFVKASREILTSYTNNDALGYYGYNNLYGNYFFDNYFNTNSYRNNSTEILSFWDRHVDDIVYIAKNAKALSVHEFCYKILKKPENQTNFSSYDIKELIILSQIKYDKTAKIFEKVLFPKLEALEQFDSEIMLSLMNTTSNSLLRAAKKYFKQTNGKFKPEDIANLIFLNTIESWYSILNSNIKAFTPQEYIKFITELYNKAEQFIKQNIELSEQVIELLKNTINKLDNTETDEKQKLMQHFINIILYGTKMPDFLFDMIEDIIFLIPYDILKDGLQNVNLKYNTIGERNHNIISLLKSIKENIIPKNSAILSILDLGSPKLIKVLTEIIDKLQNNLIDKTTLLLLFECNVYSLNKIAQNVFENMSIEKREKIHMILIDSPIERAYKYGLKKLDDWYGNKTPKQFVLRMLEHPCIDVKSYLSEKIEKAFSNLKEVQPDLYIYYVKTLLYLPNKVSKSKDHIYSTIPVFLQYYPENKKEIEDILLDIGTTNRKIDSERALVAFAQIHKEVANI